MHLHSLFDNFCEPCRGERSVPSKGFIKASLVIAAHAPAVAKISKTMLNAYTSRYRMMSMTHISS